MIPEVRTSIHHQWAVFLRVIGALVVTQVVALLSNRAGHLAHDGLVGTHGAHGPVTFGPLADARERHSPDLLERRSNVGRPGLEAQCALGGERDRGGQWCRGRPV